MLHSHKVIFFFFSPVGMLFGIFSEVFDNFSMIAPVRFLDMENDYFINYLHTYMHLKVL